jgi:hypothetical protein
MSSNFLKSCSNCNYFLDDGYVQNCPTCINFSAWKEDLSTKLNKGLTSVEKEPERIFTKENPMGKKFDKDKVDWTLMPWKELEEVLGILEFGAKKYARDNWKHVEPIRYEKAAMRHLISYITGEKKDPETNKSHLAHLICNALFLMWNDNDKSV